MSSPGLPWRFAPEQRAVKVHLGEQKLVYFSAENTERSADRRARDVQCDAAADRHLFQQNPMLLLHRGAARTASESRYAGGVLRRSGLRQGSRAARASTRSRWPILFSARPIPRTRNDLSRFPARCAAGRRPTAKNCSAERCTACHALDANKFGPMLGGVVGRKAGAVAGYPLFAGAQERRARSGRRTISIAGSPIRSNSFPA